MWHGQEPLRSSFEFWGIGLWLPAASAATPQRPGSCFSLRYVCVFMRQSRIPRRWRTPSGPGVWLCFGECGKGTLPPDHLTENKPIRLAAPMVRRPRRSKNEGLRCGLYEIIDHIEGLTELRAEHVHNQLEVQLERN